MSAAGAAAGQLEACFRAALEAVDPRRIVERALRREGGTLVLAGERLDPDLRLRVLAVGKAALPMAAAVEQLVGHRLAEGLVVTKAGQAGPLRRCAVREAGHPVPDARSEHAARAALDFVERGRPGELLLVLLSGGASSLLAAPAEGLALSDLAQTTRALLEGGAAIEELNAVRKHLSAVAGGRLALRAAARRIVVLALSDVLGDRLDVIGSGPFASDPTTYADALDAVARRAAGARIPSRVRAHLEAGRRGERPETPGETDPVLQRVRHVILASNGTALAAAAEAARARGTRAVVVTGALRGEARLAGRRLAALGGALRIEEPLCLLAGGETVVTVRGSGRGGRCQELALAAALALEGRLGLTLLAAGTDGNDGPTDAAGAFANGRTVRRGAERGVSAHSALERNDAYGFFDVEGGLLRTGPTGTNVMDLVLLHVSPSSRRGRDPSRDTRAPDR